MTDRRHAVELVREAEMDLKRMRPWTDQAVRHLSRLEEDLSAGHRLSGALRGARALEFNLKGSGAYRAVSAILDQDRVCVVLIVGPHENIYEKAKRRYRAWLRRAKVRD